MNPKVSVIIPVFNSKKYLNQAIDSILSQSLQELEIIAIDDGSTDSSLDIINNYKDPRIKVISQINSKQGAARNKGIKIAKGDYIVFLDSDDFFASNTAIEDLYNLISKNKHDIIIFDYLKLYEKNKLTKHLKTNKKLIKNSYSTVEDKLEILNTSKIGVPWNKIYKKDFILKNNIFFAQGLIYEDLPFFFKSIILANTIGIYHKPLVNYRKTNYSTMKIKNKSTLNIIDIYKIIYVFLKENDLYKDYKEIFVTRCSKTMINNFKKIEFSQKRTFLRESQMFLNQLDIESFKKTLGKKYYRTIIFKDGSFYKNLILQYII